MTNICVNFDFHKLFTFRVDYLALGIPDYPKVIRRPMDLGSMKRKLDAGQYSSSNAFENDFKLLINNCFTYNPPMTPVHKMGEQVQHVFYDMWQNLPQHEPQWGGNGGSGGGGYGGGSGGGGGGGDYDDFNEGGFDADQINLMQRQLELLTGNLEMMKSQARSKQRPPQYGGPPPRSMTMPMQMPTMIPPPLPKPSRPPPAPRIPKPPSVKRKSDTSYSPASGGGGGLGAGTASTSSAPPKPRTTKRSSIARGDDTWTPPPRGGKDSDYEDEEPEATVTFDMKRELAEKIQEFDGAKLDKVVEIIRNSAPELLGDDNKEIELDIDMLDQRTLLKLYEYVVHPVGKGRQLKPKKNKVKGRNRGVDEVAEEERINALQAQLDAMEGGKGGGGMGGLMGESSGIGGLTPGMDMSNSVPHGGRGGGDVASSSSEEDDDASDSESE